MPISGRFFPSQKTEEKVFLLLRRHWFTYAGFLLITFFMMIPLIVLFVYLANYPDLILDIWGNIIFVAVPAYLLCVLGLMLFGFIDYYLDIYIVTNERIVDIEQNGFFKRGISELHLHQVQDVSAKVVGFFPTMLHYGDIHIQTAGERENFVFKSIPNPYRISKIIIDLHEAQIENRLILADKANKAKLISKKEGLIPLKDPEDLEIFNKEDPGHLAEARKKTKEYLSDNFTESELKREVESKIEEIHKENTISGTSNLANVDNKNTNTGSNTNSPDPSGEMHENEEIDI